MNVSFDIDIGIRYSLTGLLVNHLSVDGECLCRGYDARKDEEDGDPNSSFHVCLDLVLLISLKDKLGGKIVYWAKKKVDVSFYTSTNVIIASLKETKANDEALKKEVQKSIARLEGKNR